MRTPIKSHRDLIVWQRGVELVIRVFQETRWHDPDARDLVRQMRRAAVSVPSNIAEGRGRRGTRDFANFLGIARGSLMELDTLVVIASRLEMLDPSAANWIEREVRDTSNMITTLQRRLTPFKIDPHEDRTG
jgi:four helix bundle protein